MASQYVYRLRAPKGLDATLIRELKSLGIQNGLRKIPGRKAVEVRGGLSTMWKILYQSRICEDLQVKISQSFKARGEQELRKSLQKLPWACYLPVKDFEQYKMPQTRARSYKSKLFHEKLVREILLQEVNDLPINKDYSDYKNKMKHAMPMGFKKFKKSWLKSMEKSQESLVQDKVADKMEAKDKSQLQSSEDLDPESQDTFKKTDEFQSLDKLRSELSVRADEKRNLKQLGKVTLSLVKDQGEILMSTSYEDLHKHGYKPFMRWGVLRETLTAACILESGILERARKTGKLHVWDPFCGSGSFLIEMLMMILERPCRSLEEKMPFENWPIHNPELYEKFITELEHLETAKAKGDNIDVWLIGSDISQNAIETSEKNINYAGFEQMYHEEAINCSSRPVINNPLIFQSHWPQNMQIKQDLISQGGEVNDSSKDLAFVPLHLRPVNSSNRDSCFLSLYQGSFDIIGAYLAPITNNFEDFSIISNIPYGVQSEVAQSKYNQNYTYQLQNTYRGFGRFLQEPSQEKLQKNGTFIVSQAHHYGHQLSFPKYSNLGWDHILHFSNGGINVNLLKWDQYKVSKQRKMLSAYEEMHQLGVASDEQKILLSQQSQIPQINSD